MGRRSDLAAGRIHLNRRHTHRRLGFGAVLAASWFVGLFGLDRARMSSFKLPLLIGAGLLGYALIGLVRRKLEDGRDRIMPSSEELPRTCVVLRRFGEGRDQEAAPAATVDAPALANRFPTVSPAIEPFRVAESRSRAGRRRLDYIPLT